MADPILELTDGTTTVDLIKSEMQEGVHLSDWIPQVADYKQSGIWRDNSLADGRRLVDSKWANVTEAFDIKIDGTDQDDPIETSQDLRRLLEKGADYWKSRWQDEPVYLKVRGSCETNTRYGLVWRGRVPEDANPFATPFFGSESSIIDNVELLIERLPWWTAYPPGSSVCVQASGEQEDWAYEGWAVNTAQPVGIVRDIVELQSTPGRMLAADQNQEIWRTDTGGAVWTAATTPPTMDPWWMAEDVTNSRIYVVGDGGCWRSTNGGTDWVQRNVAVRVSTPTSLIYRSSDGYLYLVDYANDLIQRSNDQGATWNTVHNSSEHPRCICDASDGYIYVGCSSGLILRSQDGSTWSTFQWVDTDVHGIWDVGDGYLYLDRNPSGTIMSKTIADAGESFSFQSQTGNTIYTLLLASTGDYYAIAASPVYVGDTYDWKRVTTAGGIVGRASMVEYSGNSRFYLAGNGAIYISPLTTSVGRTATCNDEVFVANKGNIAQFTHVWNYDASGPTWTNNFPGTLPFDILPNPMANGDAVVLTISGILDGGPFASAIFDISRPAMGTYTITWYYPSGAAVFPPPGANWTALNVYDGTNSFVSTGVRSLHFAQPSDWTTIAINGVTGHHIVGVISLVTGNPQGPRQGDRDIYTVNWPHVEVDEAQVLGDIPALLRVKAHNKSDEDYYETKDDLDLLENRLLVGLRSLDRGADFRAYINLADAQNQVGVTVAANAIVGSVFSSDVETPTGRYINYPIAAPTGDLDIYADVAIVTLGPTVSRDFYGTYHAFVRAQLQEHPASPSGDDESVRVRLQVQSGSGGITKTTRFRRFVGYDDYQETFKKWQLLDFGRVDLPVSDLFSSSELPDEFNIVVQVSSATGTRIVVKLFDLILIPVDEWAGDFVDLALEDDGGIGNGRFLDIDSLTYPKRRIRSLVRTSGTREFIIASYQPIAPGPAILQANADQRLWFLTARAVYKGEDTAGAGATLTDSFSDFLRAGVRPGMIAYNITGATSATITSVTRTTCVCDSAIWALGDDYMIICNGIYRSEPWNCHSIQLECNPRYLSFRGSR